MAPSHLVPASSITDRSPGESMAIDPKTLPSQPWKARLVEAQTKTSTPALQHVVEQVIASGVSATEVKAFMSERPDVFGADAGRRAGEAFLDQGNPKLNEQPQAGGVKAHAVRFAALPWFQRVSLPELPILLQGKGDVVVVDGERFSQSDIAALLRSA